MRAITCNHQSLGILSILIYFMIVAMYLCEQSSIYSSNENKYKNTGQPKFVKKGSCNIELSAKNLP